MSSDPPSGPSDEVAAPPRKPVSFSSWWSSVRELAKGFVHLLVLEAKQAGISLAFMLAFGVAGAVLLITGWLALIAAVVAALVLNGILGWVATLIIAAILSFVGAGVFAYLTISRAQDLLFKATRRQLLSDPSARENSDEKPS